MCVGIDLPGRRTFCALCSQPFCGACATAATAHTLPQNGEATAQVLCTKCYAYTCAKYCDGRCLLQTLAPAEIAAFAGAENLAWDPAEPAGLVLQLQQRYAS